MNTTTYSKPTPGTHIHNQSGIKKLNWMIFLTVLVLLRGVTVAAHEKPRNSVGTISPPEDIEISTSQLHSSSVAKNTPLYEKKEIGTSLLHSGDVAENTPLYEEKEIGTSQLHLGYVADNTPLYEDREIGTSLLHSGYSAETVQPRIRVIIDNDFGGDPDGLFQLAHHLLSPSVEIRGIIGSQHYKSGFYGSPGSAAYSCKQAEELLSVMQLTGKIPVYEGGPESMTDLQTPVESSGARAIVEEAMRDDTKQPLYVVCGAGLTTIASAWLLEPRIAERLKIIWIGGPEYKGQAIPPPGGKPLEYNLGIDIKAGQVVFNESGLSIWQVPRNAYRQALYSYTEIVYRLSAVGKTGKFLVDRLEDLMKRARRRLGEAYVLGDNPLVLLTALQSSWETDPSSSDYVILPVPRINDSGMYEEQVSGRTLRVYTRLDVRLMFEDLIAKLAFY